MRSVSIFKNKRSSYMRQSWKRQSLMRDAASFSRANSDPSYNNPLLSAHSISKQRPSSSSRTCHQYGKSHEWGNCPASGKICDKYRGKNHFQTVCHSMGLAKGAVSSFKKARPQQQQHDKRPSMGSNNGGGDKSKRRTGTLFKKRNLQNSIMTLYIHLSILGVNHEDYTCLSSDFYYMGVQTSIFSNFFHNLPFLLGPLISCVTFPVW